MSKITESEILFEKFCRLNGITFERVPTEATEGIQTPDYDLPVHDRKIVVEVKQINPNAEEIEQQKKFDAGGQAVMGGTPGGRVREKITAGAPQIRIRAKGKYPSILVVYNNVPLHDHTSAYDVLVAMYGLETHHIAVPNQPDRSPYLLDKKFGPESRMTKNQNTSISAIGVLYERTEEELWLIVYHNIYAEIPLKAEWLSPPAIRQFTLGEKKEFEIQIWSEIEC